MTATATGAADRLRTLAAEQMARDAWSRDQLLAHQQERLRALIAHAREHSPYYRATLDGDFASLPTLSKATLMQQWDRIVCDPRLRRDEVAEHAAGSRAEDPYLGEFQVFSTSGASGLRGLFVYSAAEWADALAVTIRALARTGARPDERTIGIGAPPGVHMSERIYAVLRTGGSDAPRISALTPLDDMVATLNAFQPDVLLGYPTIATLLAAEQLAGRLRIAPRVMAFGSEPLTVEMRERIRDAWGIDPGEYYSTTEAPVVASSTPEHPRAMEIFEDQYVIEVVDADNRPVPAGTAGARVLVTNLGNRTLPLIRYELDDSVTVSPDPNPTGRPYRHLAAIDGRTADTLTFPRRGGGTVALLPLRMGAPFARMPEVRQFQIIHERGRLTIHLVLDPAAPSDTPERVRTAMRAVLDEAGAVAPAVAAVTVTELEREPGPAAKLKLIVAR